MRYYRYVIQLVHSRHSVGTALLAQLAALAVSNLLPFRACAPGAPFVGRCSALLGAHFVLPVPLPRYSQCVSRRRRGRCFFPECFTIRTAAHSSSIRCHEEYTPVRRAENAFANARTASVSSRPSRSRQRQHVVVANYSVEIIACVSPSPPFSGSRSHSSLPLADFVSARRSRTTSRRRENDEYHDESVDCRRRDDHRRDNDGERRRAQVRQCQADLRGTGVPAQRHPEGGDFM